jgi:hypothetical protein
VEENRLNALTAPSTQVTNQVLNCIRGFIVVKNLSNAPSVLSVLDKNLP